MLYNNGFNSGNGFSTRINGKLSDGYIQWQNMVRRCAKLPNQKKYKTDGLRMCIEWYDFQIFGKWFYSYWKPGLRMVLKPGFFEYNSENCEFVIK